MEKKKKSHRTESKIIEDAKGKKKMFNLFENLYK